jgi:hypothetical protein
MASLAGRSGGDVFKGGSMWVQGLFNHTKQDSTSRNEGFKANSKGIAFGIDGKLNDAVTVGLGYGYTRTDADAGNRDIDVDGNNVFAYAEYSPDAWYVNGVLNFGYGRYTEKKSPLGVSIKSKYDVYTYGINVMTGYAFDSGLTPEGGLRYLLVDQKSYDDGVEKIKTSNNDVLTAVLGAKYGYKVKAKDWMFTPNVRLAATYDLMSDEYARQLITRHVSGRLKVAPEHCSDSVLKLMRKPSWENYLRFRNLFLKINQESDMHQQLIPYFISSHPGCTNADMRMLADETKKMHYRPEQVQDFTPTPMTLSTTMFCTGINPYTGQNVYVARSAQEKKQQNQYFFWWKK